MIFCYSCLVFVLFFIFLYLFFKNRYFLAYLFFNFLFLTHIVGIILAEFFGILELENLESIYGNKYLNGASATYIFFAILINLIFLRTINSFKIPLCQRKNLIARLQIRNVNFIVIYVLFLFIPLLIAYCYLYNKGNIPLFEGATDIARTKGSGLGNLFNITMIIFFPISSSIFILLALANRRSFLIICIILIQLMVYPVLMAHKSAMFMVLFYPIVTISLYYGFHKIKYVIFIFLTFILVYFLVFMFLHFGAQYEMYEVFWKLIFRLFVGQGSNFYLIWTDFVDDKLPYLYDFSFLKHAFYSSFLQDLFGEYVHYKKFEYEIALFYTSEWFADSWNLVTTILGESVFTFGAVGILFVLILVAIYIYAINFVFKKFFKSGNICYLGLGLLLVSFLNDIWNMGGYYQLFSINTFILFFIIFMFFYIINLLLRYKIVIGN